MQFKTFPHHYFASPHVCAKSKAEASHNMGVKKTNAESKTSYKTWVVLVGVRKGHSFLIVSYLFQPAKQLQ